MVRQLEPIFLFHRFSTRLGAFLKRGISPPGVVVVEVRPLNPDMRYIRKLWTGIKNERILEYRITTNPSAEGERIRSVKQYTPSEVEKIVKDEVTTSLENLLRTGARMMLQAALEFEVETYIESFKDEKDEGGLRKVVRNGSHKPRECVTGVGTFPIRQPRVLDRRFGQQFTSAILSKYMRMDPSIDVLVPTAWSRIGPVFWSSSAQQGVDRYRRWASRKRTVLAGGA